MPSLQVCICSNRHMPAQFCGAFTALMMNADKGKPWDAVGYYLQPFCSCLPIGRQNAVNKCIGDGVSHILFVDDDTIFPPDAAHRLLARDKPVIGVNFPAKQFPLRFQATDLGGNEVQPTQGLQEVASLGFGLLLIETRVLQAISSPHFDVTWSEHGYCPEDITCCKKIRAAGFPIFVDHDLSMECGHVGDFVYAPRYAVNHREGTLL